MPLHFYFGRLRKIFLIPQSQKDLLPQVIEHILHDHGQPVIVVKRPIDLFPVITGKDDNHQFLDKIGHLCLIRLCKDIHLINVPSLFIVTKNQIHDFTDLLFKFRMMFDHKRLRPF